MKLEQLQKRLRGVERDVAVIKNVLSKEGLALRERRKRLVARYRQIEERMRRRRGKRLTQQEALRYIDSL